MFYCKVFQMRIDAHLINLHQNVANVVNNNR
ncbi:hypothetical protein N172_07295 [Pantoea dispersa EGD-AAK13]|nr:hypothetical protein N172_07295 [Pantoea dispersa EGD-AAK13]